MSDVFISYSRKDKEFVHILHDALEAAQKNTWVDWEDILPTSEWWQEIESAIEGADTFIFVISPDSIISKNCREEIEHAVLCHKRILAIVRREVGGDTEIHADLSRHEWIFFRQSDDFDTAFQKLREALNLDIDRIHAHTRLLVKASDWDSKQRKDSFLLRGEDLAEAEKWLAESVGKSPKPTELQVTYIENSRKVENANHQANKILKRAARNGVLIAVIASFLGFAGIIGSAKIASTNIEDANKKVEDANKKVIDIKQKNKALEDKFEKLTLYYQNQETQSRIEFLQQKEKLQNDFSKEREKLVNELTVIRNNPVITSGQQTNDKTIYIQVPSESVKQKLQNLPTTLINLGYKAYGIEVVGTAISPNDSQIRYFFDDKKSKERALKLQQQLNDLGYKEFEVKYVKGFQDKVKPEMMEIWFGKDTK